MKQGGTFDRAHMAVCLFVGVLALGLVACGGDDDPGGSGAATASRPTPDVPLPAVSAGGTMPADDHRIDLMIAADGTLAVNGRVIELADLGQALVDAAGGERVKVSVADAMQIEDLEETTGFDRPLAPTPGFPPEFEEEILEEEIVVEEPIIRDEELDEELIIDEDAVILGGEPPKPPSNDEMLAGTGEWPFEPDGTRAANLVFWVAPDVPWAAVAQVMMAAVRPPILVYRTWFAVRSNASGKTRAVAVFLPKDRGLCGVPPGEPLSTVRVSFVEDQPQANAHLIGQMIRTESARLEERVTVSLKMTPGVPVQRVLDVVDGALQGGAAGFTFEGTLPTELSLAECVRRARTESTSYGVRVATTLVAGATTGDARADWPDALGFGNAEMGDEIEKIIEETPDRDR